MVEAGDREEDAIVSVHRPQRTHDVWRMQMGVAAAPQGWRATAGCAPAARGRRPRVERPAAASRPIRPSGSSQLAWPPSSVSNRRKRPIAPFSLTPPGPPTLVTLNRLEPEPLPLKIAEQPLDAVVAQRQLKLGVRAGRADVGAVGGGGQVYDE